MSNFNQQYQLDAYHRANLQQQVANVRRITSVQHAQPNRKRTLRLAVMYGPILLRLGKRLEAVGTGLQKRYGELKPVSSAADADCQPKLAG